MKTRKVLKHDNLPARLPLMGSVVAWLLLERIAAPQWVYGAVGLLFLMLWIGSIYCLCIQTEVDLLGNDKK